jgi:hypothetical protein
MRPNVNGNLELVREGQPNMPVTVCIIQAHEIIKTLDGRHTFTSMAQVRRKIEGEVLFLHEVVEHG